MEGLTRLVSESMARHGFDRPLDYRRLHWSRWFRCESHRSLLFVPSKPGVFALAEEIMDIAPSPAQVGTAALGCPAERNSSAAEGQMLASRRLLAVTHFFDAEDMAFTLDRMLTLNNPMRSRLASGSYFIRFVVVEDESQRRSIAAALNQWMSHSAEKATGIAAHFASSLELTTDHVATAAAAVLPKRSEAEHSQISKAEIAPTSNHLPRSPRLDSGAAANLHCPSPLPSGF